MSYENATVVRNATETGRGGGEHRSRTPFPFDARARHLLEEFLAPSLRELAGAEREGHSLDENGWAICRFVAEIARFQARRRARAEMLKTEHPEAPWLYRELYQLDRSDMMRRVHVMVPQDAMLYADSDGLAWFFRWQNAVVAFIGYDKVLGRRPDGAPMMEMLTPAQAYAQLRGRTS